MFYCDPEDPEAIRDLRKYDIGAKKAINKILFGIDAVNGMLARGQLFVSEQCVKTKEEAAVYCHNPDDEKEKPIDKFNHAMSALRYICAAVKKQKLMDFVEAA